MLHVSDQRVIYFLDGWVCPQLNHLSIGLQPVTEVKSTLAFRHSGETKSTKYSIYFHLQSLADRG